MSIKQIEALIASNDAETNRTPYLDMARGALRTAVDYTRHHEEAIIQQGQSKVDELKRLEAQVEALKADLATAPTPAPTAASLPTANVIEG